MNSQPRQTKLQRALVILALVLVLASAGTTGWISSDLVGFDPEFDVPQFSLQSWFEGDFQREADSWFKENFGLRDYYIRFANQINYDFFSKSYEGNTEVVVGKGGQLYEIAYLETYCGYRPLALREDLLLRFRDVRRLQNALEARGIAFFFLITPHKVSVYPEYMPESFCGGRQESPGVEYEMALEALQAEKIHFVDGFAETVRAMPLHDEVELFPRGGTHWNKLGAFYTARAILEMANRLTRRDIPSIVIDSMVIDENPQGTDRDLVNLLNMMIDPLGYEVPHPVILPDRPTRRDIRAVFVGGSFLHLLMEILEETGAFEQLDHYFYFDKLLFRMATGETGPIERSEIDWEGEIFSADLVVLEANMTALESPHIVEFLHDALMHLEGGHLDAEAGHDEATRSVTAHRGAP